jgi:diguanylate cyclase (GGDEF)-like protein
MQTGPGFALRQPSNRFILMAHRENDRHVPRNAQSRATPTGIIPTITWRIEPAMSTSAAPAIGLEKDFRRPALIVLLAFALVFLAWHGIAEYRYGVPLLAAMQFVLAIHYAGLLYFVPRRPYSWRLALAFLAPLLTLLLVSMVHPDTPSKVFIWVFVIPVLCYSLLGRRLGFALSAVGSGLALLAYLSRYPGGPAQVLDLSDSIICLGAIWVAMHLYERHREHTNTALQRLATTDALTGLHNRRQLQSVFMHLAAAAQRQRQALAVVVVDLDHFKQINDRWGHHAGDAVLAHAASLLREHGRDSDWAFRTGGEEFCLLLPVGNAESAAATAEALRRRIAAHPCPVEGQALALSASIGVAVYPTDATGLEALLSLADARMYRAKQQGRNRVISDDGEARAPAAATPVQQGAVGPA